MPIRKGKLAYIARTKARYRPLSSELQSREKDTWVPFLWGDPVYVIETNPSTATVSARGHRLEIPKRHLTEQAIFCMWQIDCGQGDAAFIRFPNGKTMMIDAGPGPLMANSPAQAPQFLYWMKWVDQSYRDSYDFSTGPFHIDAVVASHPDYDHFGGFLDMMDMVQRKQFSFGNVYHNGIARFSGKPPSPLANGKAFSQLGVVQGSSEPDIYLTTLVDGFEDVDRYSKRRGSRHWALSGTYGEWLKSLRAHSGDGVGELMRIHSGMGTLPGFDPGPGAAVTVLGPVEETYKGKPALRFIDRTSKSGMKSPSLTRNGLSVVLRVDIGDVRILMTGDLNFRSQALLLANIPAVEFSCHVGKACHHGSEDVSSTFLKAMSPIATLFSSGDNETHAHPRARVLGMAGAYGQQLTRGRQSFLGLEEPSFTAPLIYSTELSRSVQLLDASVPTKDGRRVTGTMLHGVGAGGRRSRAKKTTDWLLAESLIYGLVNVRTDGKKVVIGVLKEGESAGYQTESFSV